MREIFRRIIFALVVFHGRIICTFEAFLHLYSAGYSRELKSECRRIRMREFIYLFSMVREKRQFNGWLIQMMEEKNID